uniref:Cysteine rich secreted protein n=1 Tax=Riptortus pedestris TaxID=329032 RepID=R4WIX2_RIPPE|nr:cysteine rich secreted protein [Riptortus pedestris]
MSRILLLSIGLCFTSIICSGKSFSAGVDVCSPDSMCPPGFKCCSPLWCCPAHKRCCGYHFCCRHHPDKIFFN